MVGVGFVLPVLLGVQQEKSTEEEGGLGQSSRYSYRSETTDLSQDSEGRTYWLTYFRKHFSTSLIKYALQAEAQLATNNASLASPRSAEDRARELGERWDSWMQELLTEPSKPISVWELCTRRESLLRELGFADPYLPIKQQENQAALRMLPSVLKELDTLDDKPRMEALLDGVFTGNIFDMGAFQTLNMFEQGGSGACDFLAYRKKLPPHPWHIDDYNAIVERITGPQQPPYKRAILFVDNAGADIVLGMIPLARELLKRGSEVILTANSGPALNDITHSELVELMQDISLVDPLMKQYLEGGSLKLIASGNGSTLIDLSRVSRELAEAAEEADLVVLEGMGRAIQSNFNARFRCDVMKLAMVKDQHVADMLNCKMMDCVCLFQKR